MSVEDGEVDEELEEEEYEGEWEEFKGRRWRLDGHILEAGRPEDNNRATRGPKIDGW